MVKVERFPEICLRKKYIHTIYCDKRKCILISRGFFFCELKHPLEGMPKTCLLKPWPSWHSSAYSAVHLSPLWSRLKPSALNPVCSTAPHCRGISGSAKRLLSCRFRVCPVCPCMKRSVCGWVFVCDFCSLDSRTASDGLT